MIYKPLHNNIITLLADYGYATVDEIMYLVEADENQHRQNQPTENVELSSTGKTSLKQKTYNVLNYLTGKGLITLFSTRVKPERGYYLPDMTKRILESSGEVAFVTHFFPSKYNPSGFYHHVAVIKVHLIISQLLGTRLIQFYSEPRLKKKMVITHPGNSIKSVKVCDGEFEYLSRQDSGNQRKRIGIEVELNLKSTESRRKSVRTLYQYAAGKLSAIFIVYHTVYIKEKIKETCIEVSKSIPVSVPVFFISLPELLKLQGETDAEGLTGNKIKLNTL